MCTSFQYSLVICTNATNNSGETHWFHINRCKFNYYRMHLRPSNSDKIGVGWGIHFNGGHWKDTIQQKLCISHPHLLLTVLLFVGNLVSCDRLYNYFYFFAFLSELIIISLCGFGLNDKEIRSLLSVVNIPSMARYWTKQTQPSS